MKQTNGREKSRPDEPILLWQGVTITVVVALAVLAGYIIYQIVWGRLA